MLLIKGERMANWNVSISNPFVKQNIKELEKGKNIQVPPKTGSGLFISKTSTGFDEFVQSSLITKPDDIKLQEYQRSILPKQAANMQPALIKSPLQKTCPVENLASSLISLIDLKDSYTGFHSKAVKNYSESLAKKLNLSGLDVETIGLGAAFHDIGKIGTSEAILNKQSKLTDEEFEEIKKHPAMGSQILEDIPAFRGPISNIVKHHHENWDGSGYPEGLSKEKIPLGARIVAIDTYHAMTSDRPYRNGLPQEEAVRRLHAGAGTQWDPMLINKFTNMLFS